jgi:DNA segregation ATPase FtsK/SpoIIIE, S-DNA-T family
MRISLPALLGIDPTPEAFANAWKDDKFKAVPLGVGSAGTVSIDLRRDGPHALIAGMTRYGKSELLRTLVGSLAYAHPPNRLSFLLVDYKGESAFRECRTLPHTVGLVTDLDEHLAERALASLKAELRRREKILKQAGADDLATLEQRDPAAAPPTLVIVIDEFAALAKEVPDFVHGVVDIAQRGGSLGVHLVLATQRPAGVVTDNIRANSNLRIALRVNNEAESMDVIGAPDAGRVPNDLRGRGFMRTGHDELTEFQAAYTGGQSHAVNTQSGVTVDDFRFAAASAEGGFTGRGSAETDLKRIVDAASGAAKLLGLPPPVAPWLPPLDDVIPLESVSPASSRGASAVIGVLDEPTLQRQRPCIVDFEGDGSLLIFGASGSGKTVALRTIACSLAATSSPEELQIYGLDFGARGLVPLEALPHCGSIVLGEDEERVERLFSMLQRTLARRRDLFSATGAASLSEFHDQGGVGEPRVLVLLDGHAAFGAAFERVGGGQLVEALQRLVAEGRPLGVHFAITADRRASVPGSLVGVIQRKLVLQMTSEDEFASLGLDMKVVRGAKLPPGRGFIDNRLEVQCCLVGSETSGEGQRDAIATVATDLSRHYPDARPARIDVLPTRVSSDSLPAPDAPLQAFIGLSNDLAPVRASLDSGHFLVAGPYRSGRSTALASFAQSLRRFDADLPIHLLAPRRSPLVDLDVWTSKASGVEACAAAAASLSGTLPEADAWCVVVIDDGTELLDGPGTTELEQLVRRGRDAKVRVVTSVETEAARKAWAGWLRELRKDETG